MTTDPAELVKLAAIRDLAHDLSVARETFLACMGTSAEAEARETLARLLWDDKSTICFALRDLAALRLAAQQDVREAGWDAGEHEGCGKDTERAVAAARAICNSMEADDFDSLPADSVVRAGYMQQAKAAMIATDRAGAPKLASDADVMRELEYFYEKCGYKSTHDLLKRLRTHEQGAP